MATKRPRSAPGASPPGTTPQLISRPSELNPQVTLFEVVKREDNMEDFLADTPQRSKRARHAREVVKTEICDLENLGEVVETEDNTEESFADTPRRSKRARRFREVVKAEICDLEDLGWHSPSPPPRTPSKKRATKVKVEGVAASTSSTTFNPGSVSPTKKVQATKVKIEQSTSKTPKKRAGTASPKKVQQTLAVPHPAPENWENTYSVIKSMRSRFVAPVDTMGCQMAQVSETDPRNRRYATLVSLMLSSSTKDEVCNAAVNNLREAFGGSISVEAMIAASDEVIEKAICKVGYWKKKTTYLKAAAIRLRDVYNSDVPNTVDELCTLLGVGPKMAFLTLEMAWNVTDGIGVDVHVHRITNRLGWHKPRTDESDGTAQREKTRLNLQSWLPKELYGDINHMLVGFGQVICQPTSPRCDMCDLSTKGLCPSAQVVKDPSKRKAILFLKPDQESLPEITVALEEDTKKENIIV